MIESRPYLHEDLPRLQAALAGWVHVAGPCGYCHVGDVPNRIYEGLHGRGPVDELVHVWEARGRIAGFAICGRYGATFDVFADPELRGTHSERTMLRSAYEATRARLPAGNGGQAWVVSDVFDCDDIRANLLTELGFENYRLFDHIRERSLTTAIPSPEAPDGYAIRSATPADADQLAAVRNRAFATVWFGDAFRAEVMDGPGYDPDRELVVVTPDGAVAAFTVVWLDEVNKVGHFEPVGTHREYRRRGLARAVMLRGLEKMRCAGMEWATVGHDATNVAATALYEGLGFVKRFATFGFRKPAVDAG